MEKFNEIIGSVNGVIWSTALVVLIAGVGIWFTVVTKGIQFRRFKDACKLLVEKNDGEGESLSAFQSFATTVGARVGMGNIAGVATALYFGGPGAIVWMWALALLGGATALVETALAQAYKSRSGNEYVGGPQYFIEKALKAKPLAILFAIAAILGPGLLMPPLQAQSMAKTFEEGFGFNYTVMGIIIAVLVFLVISGGVTRIGKVAELMAPIMCVIYLLLGIIVFFMHISDVPAAFALMFKSAVGAEQMYSGIAGAMIAWGVKRGLYSNEAGQGSGPIVAAAAECSHPVKQGLVQTLSVYIDTLVVCTVSAMTIILTGMYNVVDSSGNFITEGIPGREYGILWCQDALNTAFGGTWAGKLLAILIAFFVFTTLIAYYYQAESNVRYLFKSKMQAVWAFRFVYVFACILGILVNSEVIWSMGDTGAGMMAWINVIAILILSPKAIKLCRDYDSQRKAGKDPMFDPSILGMNDDEKIWEKYVNKKKEQNPIN